MDLRWIGAAGVGVAVSGAAGQVLINPRFMGVGDLAGGAFASQAFGVASGELIVVGESQGADGWRAFRWTPGAGMVDLGLLVAGDSFSSAAAIDVWGTTIVGASGFAPSVFEARAFRWTQSTGMQELGLFAGGGTPALAHAVSANGTVIVGQAGANPGGARAFRWTAGTGAVGLGTLPGGGEDNSAALGVSWDGNAVVGFAQDATFATQAFRWTAGTGMVGLGFLNSTGFRDSRARAITFFGDFVVGESTSPNGPQEAFLGTAGASMVGLGDLPGGAFRSAALAVTADGQRVVGWSETAAGNRAFIWSASEGMRDLKTVLEAAGFNVAGWTLLRATGVSRRGQAIVGVGINPLGDTEGWVADYGCLADCNGDGALTVADWGCFQTRFVSGHPYGDCNGDGVLTVADFGCYRTVFVSGACY